MGWPFCPTHLRPPAASVNNCQGDPHVPDFRGNFGCGWQYLPRHSAALFASCCCCQSSALFPQNTVSPAAILRPRMSLPHGPRDRWRLIPLGDPESGSPANGLACRRYRDLHYVRLPISHVSVSYGTDYSQSSFQLNF